MSGIELAAWSFPILLLMIFIRIPIGLSMLVCGLVGAGIVYGSATPILNQLKQVTYTTFSNYNLSVIPLFLLMGQFAALGGLSQALFKAAEAWIGHRKGGVAMAAGQRQRARHLHRQPPPAWPRSARAFPPASCPSATGPAFLQNGPSFA